MPRVEKAHVCLFYYYNIMEMGTGEVDPGRHKSLHMVDLEAKVGDSPRVKNLDAWKDCVVMVVAQDLGLEQWIRPDG